MVVGTAMHILKGHDVSCAGEMDCFTMDYEETCHHCMLSLVEDKSSYTICLAVNMFDEAFNMKRVEDEGSSTIIVRNRFEKLIV